MKRNMLVLTLGEDCRFDDETPISGLRGKRNGADGSRTCKNVLRPALCDRSIGQPARIGERKRRSVNLMQFAKRNDCGTEQATGLPNPDRYDRQLVNQYMKTTRLPFCPRPEEFRRVKDYDSVERVRCREERRGVGGAKLTVRANIIAGMMGSRGYWGERRRGPEAHANAQIGDTIVLQSSASIKGKVRELLNRTLPPNALEKVREGNRLVLRVREPKHGMLSLVEGVHVSIKRA